MVSTPKAKVLHEIKQELLTKVHRRSTIRRLPPPPSPERSISRKTSVTSMRGISTRSEGSNAIRMTELKARFESIDEEETGAESQLIEEEPDPESGTDEKYIAHAVPERNVNKI